MILKFDLKDDIWPLELFFLIRDLSNYIIYSLSVTWQKVLAKCVKKKGICHFGIIEAKKNSSYQHYSTLCQL